MQLCTVPDKVVEFARYCASPGDGPDSADFVQFLDKLMTPVVVLRQVLGV